MHVLQLPLGVVISDTQIFMNESENCVIRYSKVGSYIDKAEKNHLNVRALQSKF